MKIKHLLYSFATLLCVSAASQAAEYHQNSYSNATITANGDTVEFTYPYVHPDYSFINISHSSISSTNGGNIIVKDNTLWLTSSSTLSIDETSSADILALHLNSTTSAENRGTLHSGYITAEGGTLYNYGDIIDTTPEKDWDPSLSDEENYANMGDALLSIIGGGAVHHYQNIDGHITVQNGTLYTYDNSSISSLDLWSTEQEDKATLRVTGTLTLAGDLYIDNGQIIFGIDSSINMNGNIIDFYGGELILQLNEALNDTTTITKNNLFVNYNPSDLDENTQITVVGTNGATRTMTLGELSVPEPTTATLSLLALLALNMRRRRK